MFIRADDLDLRTPPADVLIVGSGPAGLSCALEMRRRGATVLLLESGGRRSGRSPLNEVVSTGLPFAGATQGRARGFGGTGERWAGGCLPLEDSDLAGRAWVPGSAWPVDVGELRSWQARAAGLLGLGDATFTLADLTRSSAYDATEVGARLGDRRLDVRLLHQSPRPHLGSNERNRVAADPGLQVMLGATAVEVLVRGDTAIGVRARSTAGGEWPLSAPVTVLAGGAVENARLLLTSGQGPAGLGGESGHLGAGFQDHPTWILGEVTAADPQIAAFFQASSVEDHMARPRLTLSRAAQEENGLLSAAADLQVVHGPRSPVGAAKRIVEALEQRRVPEAFARELVCVAVGAPSVVREAWHRRRGLAAPPDPASRLALRVQTEQPPAGPSRVRLSSRRDLLGARAPEIEWRIGEAEHRAAVTVARAVADAVARTGLARVRLVPWLEDRAAVVAAACDYYHHAGTTRMAQRAEDGVVDPQCAVHGLVGLYVVGGSVFPSSGYANPTLTIMALALRLAAHLDGSSGPPPSPTDPARTQ